MQLAQSYLQGMASPFDGVLEAYGQGQQFRENRGILEAREAEQARKEQAYLDLDSLDWNDMNAVRQVVAQFPEYTKGAKDYYDALEAKEQQSMLFDMSTSISALGNDRPDIAVQKMRDKAITYRDMGNEEKAEEYSQLAEDMARDPQGMRRTLLMHYSLLAGKDAASAYASLSGANLAEEAAPYTNANTQATTGKLTSDRVNTVNQDISNAAIGKDPAAFSTVITRQYENGLINKDDYDYMMNNITDPEKAGSYLRGLAMGNPAIAAAYKPTTAYVNQGDKITAVEVDPYDGTSRTTGTYGISASPNTVYATDASERNNVRSVNQSNINSERTARTAAERNAIAKHVADTKAQVAAGKLTQQVLPDGRVVVFNTKGQMRPVIDPETGQPLISKKVDPAIAKTYREEKIRQDKLAVLLPEIRALIPESTGSVIGLVYDYLARGTIGHTSKGAAATAKLEALGGQLVMMMPRMEGPQSDKDVALYKKMAGNVASPITPKAQRLAALDAIEQLNKKYADLNESSQVKTDDLF